MTQGNQKTGEQGHSLGNFYTFMYPSSSTCPYQGGGGLELISAPVGQEFHPKTGAKTE